MAKHEEIVNHKHYVVGLLHLLGHCGLEGKWKHAMTHVSYNHNKYGIFFLLILNKFSDFSKHCCKQSLLVEFNSFLIYSRAASLVSGEKAIICTHCTDELPLLLGKHLRGCLFYLLDLKVQWFCHHWHHRGVQLCFIEKIRGP